MLIDDLYRSSSFRSHSAEYEEEMGRVKWNIPCPRIMTCAEPLIPFSHPRKVSFFEELRAWEEYEAAGGRPE
jgi:hypothetical protein